MMKANEVRQRFIDYFKKNQHQHVPSSRLVPENDPTLLFTNSGMVQFKNVFLGFDQRPYKRATTSQKCVRAGGKHNDLENVGFTARHHTFFEMLGNFSFGDYFKKDAIRFAWDFLTNDLKIPKDKLYVTIFTSDDEAFEIWNKQEKIPADRISRFGEKDNFWQMGDTGPCGPCSEIFYDHGAKAGCGKKDCKVGCSCDRYVEIWNLVFMQFNKDEKGVMTPLPKPSIDTGAGLERLAAVMQGVSNNYDTDLFTDLFKVMPKEKKGKPEDLLVAQRVAADHSRATAFLIADGVIPSNEGAGYVLRRIMRRGIRYGSKLTDRSVLLPTIKEVIKLMGDVYPELRERESFIISTVKAEEERFKLTLEQGTTILETALASKKLSGETVFRLYDTFGFPVDLTTLIAKESGVDVDLEDFERRMDESRKVAKASWKGGAADSSSAVDLLKVQSAFKDFNTKFLGYETLSSEGKVVGLAKDGAKVKTLQGPGILVLDQTPFYAEGGGQVGDFGTVEIKGKVSAKITNTKKVGETYFHFVDVTKGSLTEGDAVTVAVDPQRRATMRNHSATHLLHAALRKVLGDHVSQAGSLVEPSRLRFDFTHNKPMTREEIERVEGLVNEEISKGHDIAPKVMGYKDAIKFGAMALFGEKYGDQVRVVKMGDFSTELCGGTHVSNTSDIRVLKITSESGVSSGVRRIEAITGTTAMDYLMNRHHQLSEIEDLLKSEKDKGTEKVKKIFEQIKKLEKDLKSAHSSGQKTNVDDMIKAARDVKGTKVVSSHVEISDRDLLSQLADKIKDKLKSGIVVLIGSSEDGGPSPIVATITKDLVGKFHAGNILKEVAAQMDGKGGGRPDFAQGAAPNGAKAQAAAEKTFTLI
jgi:alanyl-tRNA synthetase